MPSAKSIAVAVTALAVSGAHASHCKPTTISTTETASTTITEAPTTTTTTAACTEYTVRGNTEGLNCGVTGDDKSGASSGDGDSFDDCAKSCVEDPDCALMSYVIPDSDDETGTCNLYGDGSFTPNEFGPVMYYESACFECVRGEDNPRGGRGGRKRHRIRRH
ncbi:hypothetical protein FALBO_9970 [Fusarium albosuccineum]|uniref:Apple domain-containing protein n=1 Tax=Fusarium albosuccineum TaxID=1237068 RepID=A0A8H4L5A3_9HYPO|nr:hypothetical protein FALBO_9970 [Fusarium albosuccineum]